MSVTLPEGWRTYRIAGRWKWQDATFALGEIVFMISLLPSVLENTPPSPWTSFPTSFMLCCFLAVHVSFRLWVTACLTLVTIGLWVALGVEGLS